MFVFDYFGFGGGVTTKKKVILRERGHFGSGFKLTERTHTHSLALTDKGREG